MWRCHYNPSVLDQWHVHSHWLSVVPKFLRSPHHWTKWHITCQSYHFDLSLLPPSMETWNVPRNLEDPKSVSFDPTISVVEIGRNDSHLSNPNEANFESCQLMPFLPTLPRLHDHFQLWTYHQRSSFLGSPKIEKKHTGMRINELLEPFIHSVHVSFEETGSIFSSRSLHSSSQSKNMLTFRSNLFFSGTTKKNSEKKYM